MYIAQLKLDRFSVDPRRPNSDCRVFGAGGKQWEAVTFRNMQGLPTQTGHGLRVAAQSAQVLAALGTPNQNDLVHPSLETRGNGSEMARQTIQTSQTVQTIMGSWDHGTMGNLQHLSVMKPASSSFTYRVHQNSIVPSHRGKSRAVR